MKAELIEKITDIVYEEVVKNNYGKATLTAKLNELLNNYNVVKNIAYESVLAVVYTITCGNSEIVEICKDEKTANKLADQMQEKDNYNSYWVDKRELK